MAAGNPCKRPRSKKGGGILTLIGVYCYMFAGITYFFISNYFNFAKIFR